MRLRILIVVTVGLLAGLGIQRYLKAPVIKLVPETVRIDTPALQRELLTAGFQLKNETDSFVEITEVRKSCGCLRITTSKDHVLKAGFKIPAKTTVNLSVAIDTTTFAGTRNQSFILYGNAYGRGISPLVGSVDYHVLPGLRLDPPVVVLTPEPNKSCASGKVQVLDGYPDPGIKVELIRSEPVQINIQDEKNCPVRVADLDLKLRQEITVTLPDFTEHEEGRVTVVEMRSTHEYWPLIYLPVVLKKNGRAQ